MMAGVVMVTITQLLIEDRTNVYTLPHDYTVEGTYGDDTVTGTGHTEYINETSKEYMYELTTNVAGINVPTFFITCDNELAPLEKLYSKGGTEIMDNKRCTWWTYKGGDGYTFRFAFDDEAIMHKYTLINEKEGIQLTGLLSK